jgi:hypothetical protein
MLESHMALKTKWFGLTVTVATHFQTIYCSFLYFQLIEALGVKEGCIL